jgi:hypothetical protein
VKQRAEKIHYLGEVDSRDSARALLKNGGDTVLVVRGHPRLMVMRCPCGCGDDLLINLDFRAGPAWRLYRRKGRITVFPSYWRDSHCGSHFVLWSNRIEWCSSSDDDQNDIWENVPEAIEQSVLSVLTAEYRRYEDLAETLDMIPWEVLQACKQLDKKGLAQKRFFKGEYRLREQS